MKRSTCIKFFVLTAYVSCLLAIQFVAVSANTVQDDDSEDEEIVTVVPGEESFPETFPVTVITPHVDPEETTDTESTSSTPPDETTNPVTTDTEHITTEIITVTPDPEPPHEHAFTEIMRREATCKDDGYVLYKCECGESYRDIIVQLEHNIQVEEKAAKCDEDGYVKEYCTVCGYTNEKVIPKFGHNYTISKVEATCTQKGYTRHTCVQCGHSFDDNIVKAYGHDYKLVSTTPSTTKQNGCKVYKCSRCSNEKTEKLPLLEGAKDTDLCGESLIEQKLPHDESQYSALVLEAYRQRYTTWQDASAHRILVPDEAYQPLYDNFRYKYRYLYDSITIMLEDVPEGFYFHVRAGNEEEEAEYKQCCDWAAQVIKELGITSQTKQKDAIALINEYICKHKYYKSEEKNHGGLAFSCFSDYGVCHNYALEFQLLCVTCGIDCEYFTSHAMNHAWNIVHFSDGSAYHVDVTYNDGRLNHSKYLLITEEQIKKDHVFD